MTCNQFPPTMTSVEDDDLLYAFDRSGAQKRMLPVGSLSEKIKEDVEENINVDQIVDTVVDDVISRAKVSAPIEIIDGVFTYEISGFNASLSSYYIYSESGTFPNQLLIPDFDYTFTDAETESITLTSSWSGGKLIAKSLNPDGSGVVKSSNSFTVDELKSVIIPNGVEVVVPELDNARYIINPTGYSAAVGDITLDSGQVASLQTNELGMYVVTHFGADKSGVENSDQEFEDAATRANASALGSGQTVVLVPSGSYLRTVINSTPCIWQLGASVLFPGAGGVSPTFVNSAKYLNGKIIRYIGSQQSGSVYYGDPTYKLQEVTGIGVTGEIAASSDRSAGLFGGSYNHRSDAGLNNMGVQGLAVNNNSLVAKGSFGGYFEGFRFPNSLGNARGIEAVCHNGGPGIYNTNIYWRPADDSKATFGAWITTGGNNLGVSGGDVVDFEDSSAAIAINRKGDSTDGFQAFLRGMVFYYGSVSNNQAIVSQKDYGWYWYDVETAGTEATASGVEKEVGSLNVSLYNQHASDNPSIIRSRRSNDGFTNTESGNIVASWESLGYYNSSYYALGRLRCIQDSAFSGGEAAGRYDLDIKDSSGVFGGYTFKPDYFGPKATNTKDLASPTVRVKTAYLVNSPDVSSDATLKQERGELNDSEIKAALSVARLPRIFQWIAEVEEKANLTGQTVYLHCSPMAQSVWSVFENEGLDPSLYGFINDGDDYDAKWSLQPQELLWMICAAQQSKIDNFESRLAALENA